MKQHLIELLFIFCFLAVAMTTPSCKVQKETLKVKNKYQKYQSKNPFQYFKAKAKMQFSNAQKSRKINLDIRSKNDSIIWVSVRVSMGIEALRCIILPTGITFSNRLSKTYDTLSFERMSRQSGFEINFDFIKSLFYRPDLFKDQNIRKSEETDESIIFTGMKGHYSIEKKYIKQYQRLSYILIKDRRDERKTLKIRYLTDKTQRDQWSLFQIPSSIRFELQYVKDEEVIPISFDLKYIKVTTSSKSIHFPFKIPSKYSRMDFLQQISN